MTKLLTIAIPTYNRAQLLDRQLNWLSNAIKGFEEDIEIFVSDNCSTDNTSGVIDKWKSHFTGVTFHSSRNDRNVGVMKNIINCLTAAKTKYVWAIGDDDPIEDRAIPYIIGKFKQYDDLSLVFLNFSGKDHVTGEAVWPPAIEGNRWFDIENEDGSKDGKLVFEHCITKSVGAVIFLTATVYRTDLVQRAVRLWPDGIENWMYLAYLGGYCAANGRTIVTKENYLVCIVAASYWLKERQSALLMQFKHLPEVVSKLAETGYSKHFYRVMMLRILKDAKLRVLIGGLRRWPGSTIRIVLPFLSSLGGALVGASPAHIEPAGAVA